MRKVIFQTLTSVDGYFEGPNQEIDWHNVDEEFNEMAISFLGSVDLLLFGRVTYQIMVAYWPTETAERNDPIVAGQMNSIQKIVFSRSLKNVEWENTRVVRELIPEEVTKLKRQPGKDIAIFGSSDLTLGLMQHGLVDEYRIVVNPILLGNGKPLFKGLGTRVNLHLLNTTSFKSGNVMLCYAVSNKPH